MNLPRHLFWDIDLNTLDYNYHAQFIINRVIERGSIENWKTIKNYYGLEMVKEEILNMRSLHPKTLAFFSTYFKIKKTNFRCYTTKQLSQKHWIY